MPALIEDYALLGNCRSAALVSCDGSIDWLCLPRFDAPAVFAALLGNEENGRWRLAPVTPSNTAVAGTWATPWYWKPPGSLPAAARECSTSCRWAKSIR